MKDMEFDYDLERMELSVSSDTIYVPGGMNVREWLDWLKTVDIEVKDL